MDNDVRIVDGNALVKNLVARATPGASPVLVGLTDTDDVRSGQNEGDRIDFVYPGQDDSGTLVIPSTVSMIEGGPHPREAKQLINYLVGPEVEAALTAEGTGYAPVRPSAMREGKDTPKAFETPYDQILECQSPSLFLQTAREAAPEMANTIYVALTAVGSPRSFMTWAAAPLM